jgi:hypothetical protein
VCSRSSVAAAMMRSVGCTRQRHAMGPGMEATRTSGRQQPSSELIKSHPDGPPLLMMGFPRGSSPAHSGFCRASLVPADVVPARVMQRYVIAAPSRIGATAAKRTTRTANGGWRWTSVRLGRAIASSSVN